MMLESESYKGYDCFIQYLGYSDADKTDVYEGDVLELKVTDDLMNHDKDTFFNSNLGKYIEKNPSITSVLLLNKFDKRCMSMDYELYFCRDFKIDRDEDGSVDLHCASSDNMFPQYLCSKGAVVIGNIVEDEDILNNM